MTDSNPSSQTERREALANDTYFSRAAAGDEELGGRFAKLVPSSIVGDTIAPIPKLPPSSPWSSGDPVPPEPPLDASDCGDTIGVALGGEGGQS